MSLAKLTMIRFNSYLNQMYDGQTLFDLLTLPVGISKDDLVDNIILQGGEFEVVYSDPVFMREAIGSWGRKCYNTFLRWITAQNIEYAPLENYDRKEDWTDTGNKGVKTLGRRDNGNERSFDQYQNESETQVSAYDSSTYQPSEKLTETPSGKIIDKFGEGTSSQETENNKVVHDGRIHGNVGVTTSQQMLQAEYEVARFNIIDQITDMFILEFCIPIYE